MHNDWASYINGQVSGANAVAQIAEAGDSSILVEKDHLFKVCKSLKNSDWEFNVLQVISGVDFKEYIEVNYILASFTKNLELIVKVNLPYSGDECPKINSVYDLWKAAGFQERECYDMLGVDFVGNPDLRRILCPDDWEGYPLRKDYVVQEKYLHMTVNPEAKMNRGDHNFGREFKETAVDPKKVSHSWVYDKETLTSPKKTSEKNQEQGS